MMDFQAVGIINLMHSVCYPNMPLTGTATLNEFKGACIHLPTYIYQNRALLLI